MSDEEQVQESAEETPEVEEETTKTTEENENSEETTSEESTETDEDLEQIRKDAKAFQDQKRRAEIAEAELKKLKPKQENDRAPKKDDQAYSALEQRVVRAELAASGIKHPDDQQFVIDAANRLGVTPAEAANDELVTAKLERLQEGRKTKEATPTPSKRGGSSSTNDVGRLADKVSAGAELPKDPALAEKVQKEIARRAQAAS